MIGLVALGPGIAEAGQKLRRPAGIGDNLVKPLFQVAHALLMSSTALLMSLQDSRQVVWTADWTWSYDMETIGGSNKLGVSAASSKQRNCVRGYCSAYVTFVKD
jgi:hypothetical protein